MNNAIKLTVLTILSIAAGSYLLDISTGYEDYSMAGFGMLILGLIAGVGLIKELIKAKKDES